MTAIHPDELAGYLAEEAWPPLVDRLIETGASASDVAALFAGCWPHDVDTLPMLAMWLECVGRVAESANVQCWSVRRGCGGGASSWYACYGNTAYPRPSKQAAIRFVKRNALGLAWADRVLVVRELVLPPTPGGEKGWDHGMQMTRFSRSHAPWLLPTLVQSGFVWNGDLATPTYGTSFVLQSSDDVDRGANLRHPVIIVTYEHRLFVARQVLCGPELIGRDVGETDGASAESSASSD